jgi:hypothetical protein
MNGGLGIGEEIQSEQRGDAAVPRSAAREVSNSGGDERHPGIATVFSSEFDEGRGRVAAYDRSWLGVATNRVGKRSGATPNI